MEALCSSETSVLTRAMQRNILENGILHSKYDGFGKSTSLTLHKECIQLTVILSAKCHRVAEQCMLDIPVTS
jgi:hypothetical protein